MLKEIAYTLYSYTVAHPVQTQVIVLVALLVYYLVVYPVTSPLWKVPGPYIHRISYIPCYNAQRNGTWIARVHELHKSMVVWFFYLQTRLASMVIPNLSMIFM